MIHMVSNGDEQQKAEGGKKNIVISKQIDCHSLDNENNFWWQFTRKITFQKLIRINDEIEPTVDFPFDI